MLPISTIPTDTEVMAIGIWDAGQEEKPLIHTACFPAPASPTSDTAPARAPSVKLLSLITPPNPLFKLHARLHIPSFTIPHSMFTNDYISNNALQRGQHRTLILRLRQETRPARGRRIQPSALCVARIRRPMMLLALSNAVSLRVLFYYASVGPQPVPTTVVNPPQPDWFPPQSTFCICLIGLFLYNNLMVIDSISPHEESPPERAAIRAGAE